MSRTQIQWHPAVHEAWAEERLVFWRLGFSPTYRRKEILQAFDIICDRHGISSFTVYEVFGNYDLLLRLWLPKAVATERVDRDIKKTFATFDLELCDAFEVDNIVRHWFWSEDEEDEEKARRRGDSRDGDGSEDTGSAFLPPELDPKPSSRELFRINELITEFNESQVDTEKVLSDPLARDLLDRHVIGIRNAEDGVKFTMVVSASGLTASKWEAMDSLEERLTTILDKARPIRERSLYSGLGFGRFMVFGKIPTEEFYEINKCLIEPITDQAALARVYRTRSETYIGSNPRFQRFSELLSIAPEDEVDDEVELEELLKQGETARIEVKGSAFNNVVRWLKTDEQVDDGIAFKGFAKAVVAMLNGNGGLVVSGVLEESSRDFATEPKLADSPRVDGLIVLGLNFDTAGWKRTDPDEFVNKLRLKLREAIEPNPLDYFSIRAYELSGRVVCAVSVKESPPHWFYLKEGSDFRFIVRRDSSSEAISGPEEDAYKRLNSRAP